MGALAWTGPGWIVGGFRFGSWRCMQQDGSEPLALSSRLYCDKSECGGGCKAGYEKMTLKGSRVGASRLGIEDGL